MSAGRGRAIGTSVVTSVVLLFLFVPLIVVALFSFHASTSLSLPFEGFSMRWYREVFESPEFRSATASSMQLAAITAVLTLFLGTLAAYGVTRSRSRLAAPLILLFLLPAALPALFTGIALLSTFALVDVTLSTATIAVAHTVVAFPFFFMIARVALERLDPMLEEAAADLGSGPVRAFFAVTLPQVFPLLLGATALAFMVSLDEFVVTYFVSGSQTTLPLFIFSRLRQTLDPSINVVSTLLMAFTLVLCTAAFLIAALNERRRNKRLTGDR